MSMATLALSFSRSTQQFVDWGNGKRCR